MDQKIDTEHNPEVEKTPPIIRLHQALDVMKQAKGIGAEKIALADYLQRESNLVTWLKENQTVVQPWKIDLMLGLLGRTEVNNHWSRVVERIQKETDYFADLDDLGLLFLIKNGFHYDKGIPRKTKGRNIEWGVDLDPETKGEYDVFFNKIKMADKAPLEEELWKSLCVEGAFPETIMYLDHEDIHRAQSKPLRFLLASSALAPIIAITIKPEIWPYASLAGLFLLGAETELFSRNRVPAESEAYLMTDSPTSPAEKKDDKHYPIRGRKIQECRNLLRILRILGTDDGEIAPLLNFPLRYDKDSGTYPKLQKLITRKMRDNGIEWFTREAIATLKKACDLELEVQTILAREISIEELRRESGEINWRSNMLSRISQQQ